MDLHTCHVYRELILPSICFSFLIAHDLNAYLFYLLTFCIIYTTPILIDFVICDKVVKVADFGVARFQNKGGVMTAETGTYRWMAPEVWLFSLLNL